MLRFGRTAVVPDPRSRGTVLHYEDIQDGADLLFVMKR